MVEFFYGLPIWVATILVLGFSLAVGLGCSFGLRRLFHLHTRENDTATALSLMQVVAAYIGILIAFSGVQVWQDFADAQNAVHRETAAGSQLYRDLATYGDETLPEAIGNIHPRDDRDNVIYTEVFSGLNNLVTLRRDRLIHSESGMPMILWIVGLFGSILIVSYTATFRPDRTNILMISGISLALGLVFLFILVVNRPYMGEFSVSSGEMSALSAKFDMLDRLSRTARPRGRQLRSQLAS